MSLYESVLRPILFSLPSESAHEMGLVALRYGLGSKFARKLTAERFDCADFGELERFGLKFKNPLGIAAGFDKNGVVVDQLCSLGFGFVEVGTVTFDPQPGNPKPRLFRLPKDEALINRAGFNNEGAPAVIERLKKSRPSCVLGVNIGKNKDVPNEEAVENYLKSFDLAHQVADYIVVNVSSPNTPGLRDMQAADALENLLSAIVARNTELGRHVPLLVKIAPDLSESEIEAITDVVLHQKLDGIIATNTSIKREGLNTASQVVESIGAGGLSGKPLGKMATAVISKIYAHSKGKLQIVGVGGILTAEDAFEKISAGACLLQAYTGLIYKGPSFAKTVNRGLAEILHQKGFSSLDDAIGSGVKI